MFFLSKVQESKSSYGNSAAEMQLRMLLSPAETLARIRNMDGYILKTQTGSGMSFLPLT